jgi:hypothetical protein
MADKEKKEIQDIFEDKRSFIHDGEKYYIDNASIDAVRQADWHYAKSFNDALMAGVATAAQMEDILEERGITGKKYEERKREIIEELNSKVEELEQAKTLEEKKLLAEEVEDVRNKLLRHNQKQSSPQSQCTESLAEDARAEFLTAMMVKDSDGNLVWDGYEDYKTTDKMALAVAARYNVMLYLQGFPSNFMELLPEAIAMKEAEEEEQRLLEASGTEDSVSSKKPVKKKK